MEKETTEREENVVETLIEEREESENVENPEIVVPEGYLSAEEVKILEEKAYLRGRNEAVEARMASESLPIENDDENQDPGIDYAFHFRKSVWE